MKATKISSSRIVESDVSDSESSDGSVHTDDMETDTDDDDDLETDQFAKSKPKSSAAIKPKEPESGDEVSVVAPTTNKFVSYGKANAKLPTTLKVIFTGRILAKPHALNLPLNYTADDYFQYCDTKTNAKYRGLAIQPPGSSEIAHHVMTFANCDLEIATKLAGKKLTPQTLLLLANVSNSLNGAMDANRAAMDITTVDQDLLAGFKTSSPADPSKKTLTMVLSTKHAAAIIKRASEKQTKAKERQQKKKMKQQALPSTLAPKASPDKNKSPDKAAEPKKSPKKRKRKVEFANTPNKDSPAHEKKICLESKTDAFKPLVPFFQALMDQMGVVAVRK